MAKIRSIRFAKEKIPAKRYEDLIEIARLVSWCMNRDYLIKTCLDHISRRYRVFKSGGRVNRRGRRQS